MPLIHAAHLRTTSHNPAPDVHLAARFSLGVLVVLIVVAPLFRGGLDPLPRMSLEYLGLLLIGLTLWPPIRPTLTTRELAFLGALFVLPLLYLLPLPIWIFDHLPGHEHFQDTIATVRGSTLEATRALSVDPFATEVAWLTTLIPIGVYLGTRSLTEQNALRLVNLFLAIALFEIIIGLFQFATATTGAQYELSELAPGGGIGGAASGTYQNRNHFSGMLEMALPLTLALFLYHFGRGPAPDRRPRTWRKKLVSILQAGGRPSLAFGLLGILFVVGVVLTRSRTGMTMGMLGLIILAIVFSRNVGGRDAFGLIGRIATLTIGFAAALGLAPALDRFSMNDMLADARWPIAKASFEGARELLPLGSGPGTYPSAFPVNQPAELGEWFINHAHNDYLEALYDVGVWAPLLLIFFLVLYTRQWSRLTTADDWSKFRSLQIGAGIGIALMLVHSLTDFNLHITANLAYFAFLSGIFFAEPGRMSMIHRRHQHRDRTRTKRLPEENLEIWTGTSEERPKLPDPPPPAPSSPPPPPPPPPTARGRNPFHS